MAIIQRGILGGFSNKIGNVVGTSWKGIAVMKSLPLSVANPKTAGQVAQRTKFGKMSSIGSFLLSTYVKPLWDRFAQKESGFNAFVKMNIDTLDDVHLFSPEDFKLSQGKLDAVTVTSVVRNNTTDLITVNWTNNAGTGLALADDDVYIAAGYQTASGEIFFAKGQTGRVRSSGSATISIPGIDATFEVYTYLSFRRADGSIVSTSVYTEAV